MLRIAMVSILMACGGAMSFNAAAEKQADGLVIEHLGGDGELIVSRDGVIYWLSTGDELFSNDTLRAQKADTATISYNGCVMTLPRNDDVTLNDEFCGMIVVAKPSMAQVASSGGTGGGSVLAGTSANAPLVVGGVVLSAGGLVAATDGGSGGVESATSSAVGAAQASADP